MKSLPPPPPPMLTSESPVDPRPLDPIAELVVLELALELEEVDEDEAELLELGEMRLVAACMAEDILLLPLLLEDEEAVLDVDAFEVTVTVGLAEIAELLWSRPCPDRLPRMAGAISDA
jgi:hypothetical protein